MGLPSAITGFQAYDDARTKTADPNDRSLTGAAGRAFCNAWSSDPNTYLQPLVGGANPAFEANRRLANEFCRPYLENAGGLPTNQPPFAGGQCFVQYTVSGTAVIHRLRFRWRTNEPDPFVGRQNSPFDDWWTAGSYPSVPIVEEDVFAGNVVFSQSPVLGAIRNTWYYNTNVSSVTPGGLRQGSNGVQGVYGIGGAGFSAYGSQLQTVTIDGQSFFRRTIHYLKAITGVTVTRNDGQPDNCGSLPPELSPSPTNPGTPFGSPQNVNVSNRNYSFTVNAPQVDVEGNLYVTIGSPDFGDFVFSPSINPPSLPESEPEAGTPEDLPPEGTEDEKPIPPAMGIHWNFYEAGNRDGWVQGASPLISPRVFGNVRLKLRTVDGEAFWGSSERITSAQGALFVPLDGCVAVAYTINFEKSYGRVRVTPLLKQ